MDTNRLKKFATEARNILIQGVSQRLLTLGYDTNGQVVQEPTLVGGGAIFLGETVSEDFYHRWQNMRKAIERSSVKDVVEEAAYTWFNRLTAIRIMVRNGLLSPVLEYESDDVRIPLIVSEARQGRLPEMDEYRRNKLNDLLDDDSKTDEQFALLIVAFCHATPVINRCFGTISDYTELLLPQNILSEGGFVDMLNDTPFISEDDYKSPELIGWLYQYYISEKKDDVFASFKKGKKAEAEDIPAATQIFTPNWIVKYMVQNTVGRIYLDNNPYSEIKDSMKYLVEPEEPTPDDAIFHFDDIHELTCADLACGSGHILNECFDILYQIYVEEGYSRKKAIEDIFKYNLTGVDLDTRAKQLAQFALLMKACQKDPSFADAHCMPKVLDMPKPYDAESVGCSLKNACLKFIGGYETVIAEELEEDMKLIEDADNLGSLMKFSEDKDYLAMLQYHYDDWTDGGFDDCPEEIKALIPCVELILILTKKYAALVMNPPYMGSSNMNNELKQYLEEYYREGKSDLMTAFMLKSMNDTLRNGMWGMINLPSWMFIASYEELRNLLLDHQHILSLLNLGRGIFGSDFGSVAFVIQNATYNAKGYYRKLYKKHVQVRSVETIHSLFMDKEFGHYLTYQEYFKDIPGCTFGFWASRKTIDLYEGNQIKDIAMFKRGLGTGDNNRFLRLWHEIALSKFDILPTTINSRKKWQKFNKGGDFHKWYGNCEYVINWENNGYEICNHFLPNGKLASRPQNLQYNYKRNISYSSLTIGKPSFRTFDDFLNDQAGNFFILNDERYFDSLFGLFNSCVLGYFKEIKNNTVNITAEDITTIPFINRDSETIRKIVRDNINISRQDWDAHETSWDFKQNELLRLSKESGESSVSKLMDSFQTYWEGKFTELHENEEQLNREFIEIYGLQEELTPEVPLDEVTILQAGEITHVKDSSEYGDGHYLWNYDNIVKQLISYAVGCMMGRYSIDKEGLILANQGDGLKEYAELVPNSRFDVDDDGIVPLMASDTEFTDTATKRFKIWLSVTFGEDNLVDNINFIEGALGKSLEDYFIKDFWKDHKKMYQNRPIYWLFSSKKGAFQCLAYMHRMNPYTAELIRTKYLLPHIEWLLNKQQDLQNNAANLTTRERKELDNITKQIAECREYHDKLHAISQDFDRLTFDLDDGVVVNYEKFGDVLAKLK